MFEVKRNKTDIIIKSNGQNVSAVKAKAVIH